MNLEMHNKIATTHLQRQAYLYVRQSTLRQVLDNSESTKRQYALRERAVALGWPSDRVVVSWRPRIAVKMVAYKWWRSFRAA